MDDAPNRHWIAVGAIALTGGIGIGLILGAWVVERAVR